MTVVPYKDHAESKKQQVAEMFNKISHKYDFLNQQKNNILDSSFRKIEEVEHITGSTLEWYFKD